MTRPSKPFVPTTGLGAHIRDLRLRLRTDRNRPPTLAEFGDLVAQAEAKLEGRHGMVEPYSHATVSRWENDVRRPGPATLKAIAHVGGVAVETLERGAGLNVSVPRRSGAEPGAASDAGTLGLGATLVRWRQRFLSELADSGATEREISLIAAWLALPAGDRADGHPAVAIGDGHLLALWKRMADTARRCLAQRGRDTVRSVHAPPDDAPAVAPRTGTKPLAEAVYEMQRGNYAAAVVLDALLDGQLATGALRYRGTARR